MRGHLIMSEKERIRKAVLSKVQEKYIGLSEAAAQMRVSYRQAKRIWKRYKEEGDIGLIHKNRGNSAVGHGFSDDFKEKALKLYAEKYDGFGPTLAAEKLEKDGYLLCRETLRTWLLKNGLLSPLRKKRPHKKRRLPRECFGELIQIDGSIHPWFGEEHGKQCLLNLVDDATTTTLSLMADGETTQIVMLVLKKWIEKYGIPQAVYVDLKSVYIGPQELSIFEQACERLGIEVIKAYSPQAKGRVERNHAVYQDRFVKELKLQGITNVALANQLLTESFVDELNAKFAKKPLSPKDAHAPLAGLDLDQVLVWRYQRQLQNDWTISFSGKHYQIVDKKKLLRAKQKLAVVIHLDGRMSISDKGEDLVYFEVAKREKIKKELIPAECLTWKKRMAGIASKKASPWGQYNPKWLRAAR